jgi:hypothetical protein
MGGLDNDPAVTVNLEARLAIEELEVREGSVLVSDVIDGTFVSAHASVGVTNTAASDIFVTGMSALDVSVCYFIDLMILIDLFRAPLMLSSTMAI